MAEPRDGSAGDEYFDWSKCTSHLVEFLIDSRSVRHVHYGAESPSSLRAQRLDGA